MADSKQKRRSLILHIISGESIGSQKELLNRLRARGVDTTQATVSRDIRELGLVKAADSAKNYRYLPGTARPAESAVPAEGAVHSISAAGHLLVVRTRPGFAQSVAAGIDSLVWREVLGTVAGDDTVLVVAKDQRAVPGVKKRLALIFSLAQV